jgi:hypothetical protein
MQDFLMQVATKIPIVGPQLVEIFQSNSINDYGEKPSEITGNTEGVFKIIENEHFLYYGEVRADDPTKILGKGIKVLKAVFWLLEGWHLDENNISGYGRLIKCHQGDFIYIGDLKNNKLHGNGFLE